MAIQQFGHMPRSGDNAVRRTAGPNGVLANLYRKQLIELDVGPGRFSDFLSDYVRDPANGIAQNTKDLTVARGNLTKELKRPGMTFSVYLKGLRFLKVVEVDFYVKCYYDTGATSVHRTRIDLTRADAVNPNDILAGFYRQILVDLDLGLERFNELLGGYVARRGKGMTFKVFLKGLQFLQVNKAEFSVKCRYFSGRASIHGTTVEFGRAPEPAEQTRESAQDVCDERDGKMPSGGTAHARRPCTETPENLKGAS
jgi:hypothetical protein